MFFSPDTIGFGGKQPYELRTREPPISIAVTVVEDVFHHRFRQAQCRYAPFNELMGGVRWTVRFDGRRVASGGWRMLGCAFGLRLLSPATRLPPRSLHLRLIPCHPRASL